MAITKSRKQALVAQYRDLLSRSKGAVLAGFSGMTVRDLEELRRKIRDQGGEFHVVKNRLAKLAFMGAGLPVPEEALEGTTVVGFAMEDVTILAKTIVEAARQSGAVRVKGGVLEGVLYSARQIEQLAELPALPVLQARLLGVLKAPGGRVAGALAGSIRQLTTVVKAFSEKAGAMA